MFVLDTHAGPGLYDLESSAAQRGNEARDGIDMVRILLTITALLGKGAPSRGFLAKDPSSPSLCRCLLRQRTRPPCPSSSRITPPQSARSIQGGGAGPAAPRQNRPPSLRSARRGAEAARG